MKKVLVIVIAALMIILCACAGTGNGDVTTPKVTDAIVTTQPPATEPPATDAPQTDATTSPTTTTEPPAETTKAPEETTAPIDSSKIQIATAEQLLAFMTSPVLDGDYVLTADITLNPASGVSDWANTAPSVVWTPVGKADAPFTGSFDGMGHKITGLYVKTDKGAGLFGYAKDAEIKNLVIGEGFVQATDTAAAGIVGYYAGSVRISDCMNLATVTANTYAAGIIARNLDTTGLDVTIDRCVNRGKIYGTNTGAATYAGGIAAAGTGMKIDSCANFGDISVGIGTSTTAAIVGGIAGVMGTTSGYTDSITNCYNVGTVSASVQTGNAATAGIVGRMNANGSKVENCYNLGKISVGGASVAMLGYVAAENKDNVDYTSNVYNSAKIVVLGTDTEVNPSFTEKGLVGAVETGSGAVSKMNLDSGIWADSAAGAPILKNVSADWQK